MTWSASNNRATQSGLLGSVSVVRQVTDPLWVDQIRIERNNARSEPFCVDNFWPITSLAYVIRYRLRDVVSSYGKDRLRAQWADHSDPLSN